jgi:hypothetical protein
LKYQTLLQSGTSHQVVDLRYKLRAFLIFSPSAHFLNRAIIALFALASFHKSFCVAISRIVPLGKLFDAIKANIFLSQVIS